MKTRIVSSAGLLMGGWMAIAVAPPPLFGEEPLPDPWCGTQNDDGVAQPTCFLGDCDEPVNRNAMIFAQGEKLPITIRVRVHVLTGDAEDPEMQTAINETIDDFGTTWIGIGFEFTSQRYDGDEGRPFSPFYDQAIDDTAIFDLKNTHAESPEMQLNVYVVKALPFGFLGLSTFPWSAEATATQGGLLVKGTEMGKPDIISRHVLSHEIGHALGLWHSYHGSEVGELMQHAGCSSSIDPCTCLCYEPAQRSEATGDLKGDLCSDTPGAPRITTCTFPEFVDNCSGNLWDPFTDVNFMSAKTNNETDRDCLQRFTTQQGGRMHCWGCDVLGGWIAGDDAPGACCMPDGTCQELREVCCANKGGSFSGEGSLCGGTGACCATEGGCQVMAEACCAQSADTFLGAETTCETQVGRCCVPPNGVCIDTTQACCAAADGMLWTMSYTCDTAQLECPASQ